MPHWVLYHSADTFKTLEEKRALCQDITDHYKTIGLPPFYVAICFVKMEEGTLFQGAETVGERGKPFIRISVDHIAKHREPPEYAAMMDNILGHLKAHTIDKGYGCEIHVGQTPRDLWRVDGMVPPPDNSEALTLWTEKNEAIPYY